MVMFCRKIHTFCRRVRFNYSYWEMGIENCCSFLKSLHDRGYNEIVISVNISVAQLMQNDFVEMITNILNEVSLDPTFGIGTYRVHYYGNLRYQLQKLERLLQLGITISIDFGKGYSSLVT